MEHMSPFDADQSISNCDNDSNVPSSWGSGFSLWEEQCFREAEDSADQERQLLSEKDAISQRLWLMFQASACSIAQLYKDRAHGQSMWLPFQVAASNVTTMYRECLEAQKKMNELCLQSGMQRRNRDMLSWLKKRKRGVIRQEELVAFICGKGSGKERHERHHLAGRSPRRVPVSSERESLSFPSSGATPSLFTTAAAGHAEHRLHHSRSPPQTFSCLSLSDSACATDDAAATDLQPFRDALALSSLTTASATVTSSNARKSRNFAQFSSPDPVELEELNAFISEEFNRNVDSKKRSFPMSDDVVMSSPTHKKPKFL